MKNKPAFIAVEALVGFAITVTSCLVLAISFDNMNHFLNRRIDEINAYQAFIKLTEIGQTHIKINNCEYQLVRNGEKISIENQDEGTIYQIEKK
ncbi:hypothetical protein Q2T76_03160 [Lactobacillus sp. YT155]|uniref:hypothetical protein n=1 Tax=Lactobacillus sp. YT155 TaxID=3060955 RepID=UPI00265E56EB|nr:hypothetical protein [Lactobacillus sp. YT155]MDO1605051.1 hypothetical protein [Lactobacillus sp. YT155]